MFNNKIQYLNKIDRTAHDLLYTFSNICEQYPPEHTTELNVLQRGWQQIDGSSPSHFEDSTEIDHLFLSYFSDATKLKTLTENIKMKVSLLHHGEIISLMIDGAYSFHQNKDWLISNINLMFFFERVFLTLTPEMLEKQLHCILTSTEKETITKLRGFHLFLKKIYSDTDFNGREPEFIHRHWIKYGISNRNYSQVDSLQLFSACLTLLELFDFPTTPIEL